MDALAPTPDRDPIEGQEVRLTPNDPVPADPQTVLAHLRRLLQQAKVQTREPVRLVARQEVGDVDDAVVASAVAQAEEELAELEDDFAKEAERRKHAPLPPATQPARERDTANNLIDTLHDAAEEGIEFEIDLDDESE
jgi:hypothetical protein